LRFLDRFLTVSGQGTDSPSRWQADVESTLFKVERKIPGETKPDSIVIIRHAPPP
jgi:hypothetical protein